MSHRGKDFVKIYDQAEADLRELLNVPSTHKALFLQGGATLQFSAVPLNLFGSSGKLSADYVVTGQWSEKAAKEANKYGTGVVIGNGKENGKYGKIPGFDSWTRSEAGNTAYLHYCANETVNGVEFHWTPQIDDVPLVCDMSSNFLSKPVDVSKYALIYAGAQKNMGPAGNTVVLVDEKFLGNELKVCPTYCSYKSSVDAAGMYNTPACYSIYVTGVYLKYMKEKGGLSYWDEISDKKSKMLYDIIDGSDGFYSNPVEVESRSRMNIPFQILGGNEALEKKFLEQAKSRGLVALAGHRSVGGIRGSLYNGMPLEGVQALADFMKDFISENPQ